MNNITLIGRLVRDAETKQPTKDFSVTEFCLAVNKPSNNPDDQTAFINCKAYNKIGDVIYTYTHKGSQIGVTGYINTRNYDDKDGIRHYITEVVVNTVDLLDPKPAEEVPVKKTGSYRTRK